MPSIRAVAVYGSIPNAMPLTVKKSDPVAGTFLDTISNAQVSKLKASEVVPPTRSPTLRATDMVRPIPAADFAMRKESDIHAVDSQTVLTAARTVYSWMPKFCPEIKILELSIGGLLTIFILWKGDITAPDATNGIKSAFEPEAPNKVGGYETEYPLP